MMSKIITVVLFLSAMMLMTTIVLAQAPPPSTNPPGAPIDGLVTLLLTAGLSYGLYNAKNETKK